MIFMAFRHGWRAAARLSLRWDQANLQEGCLAVPRRTQGQPATHPLRGPALRRLPRASPATPSVFVTERRTPMTTRTSQHLVARAGKLAGLGFPIASHLLRHATGFKLANEGQDLRAIAAYLGPKHLNNTRRYTQRVAGRFKGCWRDERGGTSRRPTGVGRAGMEAAARHPGPVCLRRPTGSPQTSSAAHHAQSPGLPSANRMSGAVSCCRGCWEAISGVMAGIGSLAWYTSPHKRALSLDELFTEWHSHPSDERKKSNTVTPEGSSSKIQTAFSKKKLYPIR
jgi:hypothetical protein